MQVAISQTHLKLILVVLLALSFSTSQSQTILSHGFAHNDYWHRRPLFDALENGYSHLEADIYLRNGELIVAHILPRLKKKKTLEQLYFKPLLQCVQGKNKHFAAPLVPITLMIDIKSDADKTYAELNRLLQKYSSILSSFENGQIIHRQVTIVITGHKPYQMLKEQNYRLAFIDEDLMKIGQDNQSDNIYKTASCKYSRLISWQGEGEIPAVEKERLSKYVAMAHQYGKKVRLWASPENKAVWAALLECGVDLINTDQLVALRNFLMAQQLVFAKNEQNKEHKP